MMKILFPSFFAGALIASCHAREFSNLENIPANFVSIADIEPSILLDIKYFTTHNFVGEKIVGYEAPKCLLTKPAANALKEAQNAAQALRKTLKIYDCYRPQRSVDQFVRWAKSTDIKMKKEFYPALPKSALLGEYIATRSGHSRGYTVDLTLVDVPAKPQRDYIEGEPLLDCRNEASDRFPDNSVDMGTGFDCFDPQSHTASSQVSPAARANRMLLKSIMENAGFNNLKEEWWHYTLKNVPTSAPYYDFPVE